VERVVVVTVLVIPLEPTQLQAHQTLDLVVVVTVETAEVQTHLAPVVQVSSFLLTHLRLAKYQTSTVV
jgi:hypothetical protein